MNLRLNRFSGERKKPLASCMVIVEPPQRLRPLITSWIPHFMMRRKFTPLCSKKFRSSIEVTACTISLRDVLVDDHAPLGAVVLF